MKEYIQLKDYVMLMMGVPVLNLSKAAERIIEGIVLKSLQSTDRKAFCLDQTKFLIEERNGNLVPK